MPRKTPMGNFLKKIMWNLGISQNRGIAILYIAVGVILIVAFLLIFIIWRRRKFRKIIDFNFTNDGKSGDEQPKDNYESIIRQIKQVNKKYKSILFISAEMSALPVTIPVNVAIGLAKEKKTCMIIDLDLGRDAVAKVFGIDAERSDLSPRSIQTDFENLWVWPGHNFSQSKQMNVTEIVEKALKKFDFILINAPASLSSPDRKQIISAARVAFICTKDTSEKKQLTELIEASDCRIIGHIQMN